MGREGVVRELLALKRARNAVILAHNYQPPEIQDVADFVGDSLDLSRRAAETDCSVIVFCGVLFMAQTAKILAPGKKVLLPRKDATCPMAATITAADVRRLKKEHPGAAVVAYVNTTAEVKAECDACCTSANAVEVVDASDSEEVIFVPDRNLASWVQDQTGKHVIPWDGFCHVHQRIRREDVERARAAHPDAVLIVHPECTPDVIALAERVLSTSGMIRYARSSQAEEFLVGTEAGLLHRLAEENPGKRFYSAGPAVFCRSMKLTGLEDVLSALVEDRHEVDLPREVAKRARSALEAMVATA